MVDKKKIKILSVSLLIFVTLAFIWGNSMASKSQSGEGSTGIYVLIKPFLDWLFGKDVITHGIFRKIIHFCEFAVLGGEIVVLYHTINRFNYLKIFEIESIGLFVAVFDETLQIIFDRGPAIVDVLIDFGGFTLAVLIGVIVYAIKHRKRRVND